MHFVLIQFRYLDPMMSSRCGDDNKLVIASFHEMCVISFLARNSQGTLPVIEFN